MNAVDVFGWVDAECGEVEVHGGCDSEGGTLDIESAIITLHNLRSFAISVKLVELVTPILRHH